MSYLPATKVRYALSRFVVAVILTSTCMAQSPTDAANPQVQAALQRGAQSMHAGNAAAAEQAFREAVRISPDLAEAHIDLGLVLGREGKIDEAIASLRQGVTLDPNSKSAHMFLGIFLYQKNQPDEARHELESELALAPNNAEACLWLSRVELAQGHPDRAAAALDRAAEITPNDMNILELRGFAHNQVAKDSFTRMARIDPNNWHVHNAQGKLYADDRKHAEAIVEFSAAIKQEPNDPDLYQSLGDEYRATTQLEAAEAAFQKGYDLAPNDPVALYNLGSIKVERGQDASGVDLLLKLQQVYPGSPIAEYYLGRGLSTIGKDEDAAKWLQKSATDAGNGEVAKRSYYELTRVYRKLKRLSDAQAALVSYNRLRLASEKQGAEQVEKWKQFGDDANPGPAPKP